MNLTKRKFGECYQIASTSRAPKVSESDIKRHDTFTRIEDFKLAKEFGISIKELRQC